MTVEYAYEIPSRPEHFVTAWDGMRRFEVRSNLEESFEVGQHIKLREWEPLGENAGYSGRWLHVKITYVLDGRDGMYLHSDHIAFGFLIVRRGQDEPSSLE